MKDNTLIDRIDGPLFADMFRNAAAMVENNKVVLNELNVFPVPDGDTGTNMSMTIRSAADEITRRCEGVASVSAVADVAAAYLLRGARGNSGVITSLLFRGISKYFKADAPESCDAEMFANAMQSGVDAAYKAVMKPTEGTILTVSRMAAAAAKAAAAKGEGVYQTLKIAYDASLDALEKTTHQNPVLEKAGVVDAGGKGYCFILEGFVSAMEGRAVESVVATEEEESSNVFGAFDTEDIKFEYCTEFIIDRAADGKSPMLLRAWLENIGDCVVVVDDDEIIKVHVHSNHPGSVLEEALTYGKLSKVKIENMKEQHTSQLESSPSAKKERVVAAPEKKYGFAAVAAGEGICAALRDLGVDTIVEGGQTMNPSTEDILVAIDAVPAEIVYVFPNNKNIIMAAEQAIPLSDKRVIVIPTKTIPQGITAMLSFDPDAEPEANSESMVGAIAGVQTGQITYAARDAVFDGHEIKTGDILAISEGKLAGVSEDIDEAAKKLFEALDTSCASFVTIFYGEGRTESEAEEISEMARELMPDAEINVLDGGQPVYYYIVSVE